MDYWIKRRTNGYKYGWKDVQKRVQTYKSNEGKDGQTVGKTNIDERNTICKAKLTYLIDVTFIC